MNPFIFLRGWFIHLHIGTRLWEEALAVWCHENDTSFSPWRPGLGIRMCYPLLPLCEVIGHLSSRKRLLSALTPLLFRFSGNLHFLIKPTLVSVTERWCDRPSHVSGALSERRTPKYVPSAVCIISPSYHQTHLTPAKQPPTPSPWTGRQQPPPVYTFTCCLLQPIRSRNREADFGGT